MQDGTPAEVLRYPRNALVARLVGHRNIFSATVREHDQERGLTEFRWQNLTLELQLNPALAPGDAVEWVIHPAHIIMHRPDRPSFGERENPVHGHVVELLELGESALVSLAVDGDDGRLLRFSVSRHSTRRNRLEPGAVASVSLLAGGIHLMPPGG